MLWSEHHGWYGPYDGGKLWTMFTSKHPGCYLGDRLQEIIRTPWVTYWRQTARNVYIRKPWVIMVTHCGTDKNTLGHTLATNCEELSEYQGHTLETNREKWSEHPGSYIGDKLWGISRIRWVIHWRQIVGIIRIPWVIHWRQIVGNYQNTWVIHWR